LQMPLPDFLIPLPVSFWQKQQAGFDTHLMLAEELGKILSVPVKTIFKQKFDRAHFLTQGEFRSRMYLSGKFEPDRRVLLAAPLLDDDLLRQAGQELRAFFPTQVHAVCFAQLSLE
jgi:predicted amidophosphoribosyltransferase